MPFQPRADINWDAIFAEWSLGILSNRELARKYGVGESTIRDHANKRGWQRDLRRRVVQHTRQILDAQDQRVMERRAAQDDAQPRVRDSNGGNGHLGEHVTGAVVRTGNVIEAIVDEVVAARIDIVRQHRYNVGRYREIIERYGEQLHTYLCGNDEQKALAAKLLFNDRDTLGTALKVLGDALTRVQSLERENYGIQGVPQQPSDPNAIGSAASVRDFDFSKLSEEEIRALLKLSEAVIDVTPGDKPPPTNGQGHDAP